MIFAIPFSGGSERKGSEASPEKLCAFAQITPKKIQVDNFNLSLSHAEIEKAVAKAAAAGKRFLALGGDHSITYSILKGLKKALGRPGLVCFDAHPDALHRFVPTNENWLRSAVEDGIVAKEDICLIGVREIDGIERRFCSSVCTDVKKQFCKELFQRTKAIHISIDFDAFDPSCAPCVAFQAKDGLTPEQFMACLSSFKTEKLFSADIVEIACNCKFECKTLSLALEVLKALQKLLKIEY